jgi:GT2 family glycosyltransferase
VPDVTVVIANHNGASFLPDCLDTLATQTLRPAEIVVVDAESSDASVAVARDRGATVLEAANRGLGHLYNAGAAQARTELVLLANNDVAFDPHCVELLAAALADEPRRFAADPQQLDWDAARRIHGRTLLHRGPLLRTPLPGLVVDANADAASVVPTVFANAGVMLVRGDALHQLRGFDETFFLDFEDLDLGWRAWRLGWESVYVPGAIVRHRVNATTGPASYRRLRGSHHNLLRFALKNLPARAAARVVAAETVRLLAHPRPVGAAFVQLARELPEIRTLRRDLRPDPRLLERLLSLAAADCAPGAPAPSAPD